MTRRRTRLAMGLLVAMAGAVALASTAPEQTTLGCEQAAGASRCPNNQPPPGNCPSAAGGQGNCPQGQCTTEYFCGNSGEVTCYTCAPC